MPLCCLAYLLRCLNLSTGFTGSGAERLKLSPRHRAGLITSSNNGFLNQPLAIIVIRGSVLNNNKFLLGLEVRQERQTLCSEFLGEALSSNLRCPPAPISRNNSHQEGPQTQGW